MRRIDGQCVATKCRRNFHRRSLIESSNRQVSDNRSRNQRICFKKCRHANCSRCTLQIQIRQCSCRNETIITLGIQNCVNQNFMIGIRSRADINWNNHRTHARARRLEIRTNFSSFSWLGWNFTLGLSSGHWSRGWNLSLLWSRRNNCRLRNYLRLTMHRCCMTFLTHRTLQSNTTSISHVTLTSALQTKLVRKEKLSPILKWLPWKILAWIEIMIRTFTKRTWSHFRLLSSSSSTWTAGCSSCTRRDLGICGERCRLWTMTARQLI